MLFLQSQKKNSLETHQIQLHKTYLRSLWAIKKSQIYFEAWHKSCTRKYMNGPDFVRTETYWVWQGPTRVPGVV